MIIDFSTMPQEEKLAAAERAKVAFKVAMFELLLRLNENPATYDVSSLVVPSPDAVDYAIKRDLKEYSDGLVWIDNYIASL